MNEEGKGGPLRALAMASSISVEMAATTVIGFMIGRWADGKFHTDPWLMLLGLVLGMAGGMWGVIRILETFRKKDEG
ncbi:AtpZ/AtpI family protein [Desulforamulus ruminis]|uniref:ATP synthase protein I n=1 Tax=Desulforamulus ruminis (strain ATCC 23193 / DSM 2154 / NCIMB 8452 / DL) TaxID=696281 RepID=F6DP67_DESRL|nr:AtpZ/AtpI family protein [Desulforamulus ruminis]AEG61896.1 hypothetical protein Desru_3696 [Desulforamulus ruminis DSM 2154]